MTPLMKTRVLIGMAKRLTVLWKREKTTEHRLAAVVGQGYMGNPGHNREGDVVMNTHKTILCATLALLFVLAGSVSAAYYTVIDLGTLPGGSSSYAASINDNGHIAGYVYIAGWSHSCRFDPTGGGANIDLGGLGGPGSVAWSINNSAQIVGGAHIGSGFSGRACLFDPTGGGDNKNLGILPGYEQSGAYSINNNGQIVGQSENYGPGYASYGHACIFYATGGSPTDLGALGSYAPYSGALSNNDHGQIVGWAGLGTTDPSYHACLFDPTGGGANINLGGLGGAVSYVYSNNNDGQIVGVAHNSSGNARACLFDATGGGANIDLGTLVGFDNSWATSINDNNQIVGGAGTGSTSHACLFDSTGGGANIDLNTLLDPSSGWTLTNASDINNDGWIVGYGINSAGQTHAYLLTPEPATICLLALGGLAILGRRKTA